MTVSVTVNVPCAEYVCDAVGELELVLLVPSPQLHAYCVMEPVESLEPPPLTDNGEPIWPE